MLTAPLPGETPGLYVEKDGKRICLYAPTPLQQRFHESVAPNCIMEGSRASGKSTAMRFDAHTRCLGMENFKALIIRRVMPELKKSHLIFVGRECDLLGPELAIYNRSEFTVRYPQTNSLLMFGHAEDDRAVEKYLSSEWDAIYFDEIVTFMLREFLLISASARTTLDSGRLAIVRGGTNSVGRGAKWVKQYFLDKNPSREEAPDYLPEEWEAIHMDMDDNPHIDMASYEKRLMALPSEALRKAYRYGEWVTEGAMFSEWMERTREGQSWHVIDEIPRIKGVPITDLKWVEIVRALDWGYAPEGTPGCCLWFACMPDGTAVCFQEYYFKQTLPEDAAAEIKRRSQGMRVRYTVADPQMFAEHRGESLAETFARAGVPLDDGDNERISGWVRLHAWLRETVNDGRTERPRLQFYSAGCPTAIRTMPQMVIDPKNPEDMLTRGVEDEAADCARYFVMSRPSPSKEPPVDNGVREMLAYIAKQRKSAGRLGSEAVRRAS
jgi:hypothetical protein